MGEAVAERNATCKVNQNTDVFPNKISVTFSEGLRYGGVRNAALRSDPVGVHLLEAHTFRPIAAGWNEIAGLANWWRTWIVLH